MVKTRTSEQEAARRRRQINSALATKCRCGNEAGLGQTQCGACRIEPDEREYREHEFTAEYMAAVRALQERVYPPDAWDIAETVFDAIGKPIRK